MTTLQIGEVVRGEIRGGVSKRFKVFLREGAHARIVIQQQRIILSATLRDAALNQIIETDNSAGGIGPIYISLIAREAGDYFVDVSSIERWANAGHYEVSVQQMTSSELAAEQLTAEAAFAEARRQFKEGKKESREAAIRNYERSLAYWNKGSDPHWLGLTLYSLAVTHRRLGNLIIAGDLFDRTLQVPIASEDWRIKASCLNDRGLNLQDLKNFPLAFESLQEALRLYRQHDDRRGEASALNNLGLAYHRLGQLEQARQHYQEALPLRRAEGDQAGEFNVLSNIGGIYDVIGEPQKALPAYEKTLAKWLELDARGELGNRDQLATAFNNVAEVFDKLGEPHEAISRYMDALRIVRETGNKQREAVFLDNIGELHQGLGDPITAVASFGRALEILREKVKDTETEANIAVHLGEAYFAQGQFDRARQLFQKAKELRTAPRGQGIALARLGSVYAKVGDYKQATATYESALKLSTEASDARTQAWILHKQGELHALTGDTQTALSKLGQALVAWRAVHDPRGEAGTLNEMARIQYSLNNLNQAATYSQDSLRIVESVRTKVTGRELRTAYFAIKQNYYELDVQIRMKLYRATGSAEHLSLALQTSERAKARSLLDSLGETTAGLGTHSDEALVRQRNELRHRINAKAERQILLATVPNRDQERAKLEKEIDELLAEASQLETTIGSHNPKYRTLTKHEPVGINEIQSLLDDQTVFLEFFLGEDKSFVWAVSPTSGEAFELPSRETIESLARRLYQTISKEERLGYPDTAIQLGRMLLGPVATLVKGKRIVIVADGVLQYIPFSALLTQSSTDGSTGLSQVSGLSGNNSTTVRDEEVVYLPSASVLRTQRKELSRRPLPPNVLAILADPVYDSGDTRVSAASSTKTNRLPKPETPAVPVETPVVESRSDSENSSPESTGAGFRRLAFSKREADDIVAIVRTKRVFQAVGFSASLSTVTSGQLSKYRIVHFATHATIDSARPQLSALVLSRVDRAGQRQNGFLRLHDIYDLQLNADLVVLSACDTALGRDVKGEGLISLTRGFMYAGAKRVVASLWKVDDSATAALMAQFYKEMFMNKRPPAEALKEAQIYISNQKRWRSPYYWAGFVMQGEWR